MELRENHILIGLGGTGGKILKAFRKRIYQEYNEEQRAKLPISYLYVDSSMEMMQPNDVTFRVLGQDASFQKKEFLYIKDVNIGAIFQNLNGYPGVRGFVSNPTLLLKTIGTVGSAGAAAQKRKLGRILFACSAANFNQALNNQYAEAKAKSGKAGVNIHIFTGLAGGTGSGSIIDVVAQTRKKFPEARITVYCMIPETLPPGSCDAGRYHANGYAALTELNGLMTKTYMPCDVSGDFDRVPLAGIDKIADSCIVYSVENENDIVIDSFNELPIMVSDFLYYRIFLEKNKNTEEFMRSYTLENIEDWDKEFDEKARVGNGEHADIVRSKRFSSFGIKRVIIPEEEIIEYFTYSFARQSLLQFRYNNWSDDFGFRDEPYNMDYVAYVKEKSRLEAWRLTNAHLILDVPVLKDDKGKWTSIKEYWSTVVPAMVDQAGIQKNPLSALREYCEARYASNFRKSGVNQFYEDKISVKKVHGKEIVDAIESDLFSKWSDNSLSLFQLLQIMSQLTTYVDSKKKELNDNISKKSEEIDKIGAEISKNEAAWGNVGLLSGALGKKKQLLQVEATLLEQLYVRRTELAGTRFGVELLGELRNQLMLLETRVEKFVMLLADIIDEMEERIATRCNDDSEKGDFNDVIIRMYDEKNVKSFTNRMIKDKKEQDKIVTSLRHELVSLLGSEPSFTSASANLSKDQVTQLFDTVVRKQVIELHDSVLAENERVINRNIIEQLSEKLNTESSLKEFALDVVEKSGVFMTFDQTEVLTSVVNNPVSMPGQNILRKVVLVSLPKTEGQDEFVKKLTDAIVSCVDNTKQVYVDTNGSRNNEITVASISYCFPLRALKSLKFMKTKYDLLVNNANSSAANESREILHTEGDGTSFKDLFVAAPKSKVELTKDSLPYVMIAKVMDLIQYQDLADGTGRKAFCVIEEDDFGPLPPVKLSDKYTTIVDSPKITEDFMEKLRENILKQLSSTYLHVDKRLELTNQVKADLKAIVLVECGGNSGVPLFTNYREAAIKACEIINNN